MDITAARTHRIITVCERLKIPVLADKAYEGVGGTVCSPFKRHCGRELTAHQKSVNAHTFTQEGESGAPLRGAGMAADRRPAAPGRMARPSRAGHDNDHVERAAARAVACERHHLLHPEEEQRVPWVTRKLNDAGGRS